ncbi:MAG: hypothetical protein AAGA76_06125 [Pseudomonadota bacterium]
MNKEKQPNEIRKRRVGKKSSGILQHNSVTDQGVPVLIKKKRHFGGLMCPPIGSIEMIVQQSTKRD